MLSILLIAIFFSAAQAVNFQITNREGGTIWVGILGNPDHPTLENGGFVLNSDETRTVEAPDNWAGRFWPRTYCNDNYCETGDCGNGVECDGNSGTPPATLVEITLQGSDGQDFYDVSLVDGFNVPASIEPVGGETTDDPYRCTKAGCDQYLNDNCPEDLRVIGNGDEGTIGCKSACAQFSNDEYCCNPPYDSPESCQASGYAEYFEDSCPNAYAWAYDDHTSTFTCADVQQYNIVFGI